MENGSRPSHRDACPGHGLWAGRCVGEDVAVLLPRRTPSQAGAPMCSPQGPWAQVG